MQNASRLESQAQARSHYRLPSALKSQLPWEAPGGRAVLLRQEEELRVPGLAPHAALPLEQVQLSHRSRCSAGSWWVPLLLARSTRLWVCTPHVVLQLLLNLVNKSYTWKQKNQLWASFCLGVLQLYRARGKLWLWCLVFPLLSAALIQL